MRPWME
jgi:hypothetical protein